MSPKPKPTTASRVLEAVAAYCDVPRGQPVTLDMSLVLGAGSILALEDEFKIQLTRREAEGIKSVGQLIVLIQSRVIE